MPFFAYLGVAFGSKWFNPHLSILVSVFSVFLLDILSFVLIQYYTLAGGLDYYTAAMLVLPLTHSLVMAITWSIVAALVAGLILFLLNRKRPTKTKSVILKICLTIAILVFSSWLIDLITLSSYDYSGLPIAFGTDQISGLGLGDSLIGVYAFEFILFAAGLGLYIQYHRSHQTLANLKKRLANSRTWQTHSPGLFKAFLVTFACSFIFVSIGLFFILNAVASSPDLSPDVDDDSSPNFLTEPVNISQQFLLNVPEQYLDRNLPVNLTIELSSESYFAQNTLIQVNASAWHYSTPQDTIDVVGITVQPLNAYTVFPNQYSAAGFTDYYFDNPCVLFLYDPHIQNGVANFSEVSDFCKFTTAGPISFLVNCTRTINTQASSEAATWQTAESSGRQEKYSVVIPSNFTIKAYSDLTEQQRQDLQSLANQREASLQVRMQSIQAAILEQQEANQDRNDMINLGFTFVIIFLTLVEISFVFYEQSKDEERSREYYKRKKRKEKNSDLEHHLHW
ncbi:MAG: hypothetical protein NWE92_05440 [Candidatus Bathyarchaeota archaeon]|nr:hypothetical protein [Candidatus Bathyarchaeota archaeon]